MNYLKSLALLLLSISMLTSCSADEDFMSDVYTQKNTKTFENDTKATENEPDVTEPNDTTDSGSISILFDEPEVEDIDYTITLP